eukprot:9958551-Ditylum_brightwellii.AAC.1
MSQLHNSKHYAQEFHKEDFQKRHGIHCCQEECFVYGNKIQIVESLQWCFTTLHYTKAPSGDPLISQ